MAKWNAVLATAVLLAMVASGTVFGAAAQNQDEVLNFDRTIKASVDNFRILRTDNKAQMNDYVTKVFKLNNAKCMEVLPYVAQAVALENGVARTLKYTKPDGSVENYIQVVCPPFQMKGIAELITAFDQSGITSSPGDTRYFYRMQHRDAADVNAILVASELSGEGASAVDAATNTIYFRDSESDFNRGLAVVKFMDVPVPQVEFEVRIYEIEKDDEAKIGLDWDAWKNMLTGGFLFGGGTVARNAGVDGLNTIIGIGGPALAQFLNYTAKTGNAKILTNTRLSVQNGQPAVFSSLKRIPFQGYATMLLRDVPLINRDTGWVVKQEQSTSPNAPGGNNQRTNTDPGTVFGEKSEGVYLAITPTIGTTTLSASVLVTVNSLVGFTKLDAPIITERRTSTTVTLTPGKVFTLSGMDKETAATEKRYIPVLNKIPILGALFEYNVDVARKSRIFVVIKPHVKNQLLYNRLSLGWGTTAKTLKPDSVVFDQSRELKPNPAAHVNEQAVDEAFGADKPLQLKWGDTEWLAK